MGAGIGCRLLDEGSNIKTAQERLGHASRPSTARFIRGMPAPQECARTISPIYDVVGGAVAAMVLETSEAQGG
jgi:hypothetical protein